MDVQPQDASGWRLEGLVLRDGAGRLYEVPRAVIERYRVVATEIAERTAATADALQAGLGTMRPAAWRVAAGIYVAATVLRPGQADIHHSDICGG
jgi:hypothetical protein